MLFRKNSATKITIILFLLSSINFTNSSTPPDGEQLFRKHCAKCHGADGSKGKAGKNKLDESIITQEAIAIQIENGKKGMPAFKKKLSQEEIAAICTYILTLRK